MAPCMPIPCTSTQRSSAGGRSPISIIRGSHWRWTAAIHHFGLPETAVRGSKDRIRAALLNSLFDLPPGRITVNLATDDLPKEGGRFDLPIVIGILAGTRQIESIEIPEYEFVGELALMGGFAL